MIHCLRAAVVLTSSLLGAGALVVGGARTASRLVAPPGSSLPSADDLVVGAAGLGLAVSGCWLLLATLDCLRELLRRGGPAAARATRAGTVRHWLLRACGPAAGAVGAAMLSLTPPALADEGGDPGPHVLVGLPVPDRPVLGSPHRPVDRARPGTGARAVRTHTVVPGESLWSIASRLLGPRADPAAVDRGWRAIHHLNRDRIGPDPDLVFPGTRLDLPASLHRPRPSSR